MPRRLLAEIRRPPAARFVASAALALTAAGLAAAADHPRLSSRLPHADIGVGLGGRPPEGYTAEELALIRDHFSSLTPEVCMKPIHLQPEEGRFEFADADTLVAFAAANRQRVAGHTLVWARDECTPGWMLRDGDQPAGRDLVLSRMTTHIREVVGRYRGRIGAWDVVNEALDDGGDLLRPSGWRAATDSDFIGEAFRAAHATDPEALLIYNDYNLELPEKHPKLMQLLRLLLDKGVPVQAVGIQGHFELDRIPYDRLEALFSDLRSLGLKAVVSELDLAVVARHRWWADDGAHREELEKWDPYREACPPLALEKQAEEYRRLFALFDRHADVIVRVTFWNLHDGRSWLNEFPWKHVEHPLLFDRECRPKPAFHALFRPATP